MSTQDPNTPQAQAPAQPTPPQAQTQNIPPGLDPSDFVAPEDSIDEAISEPQSSLEITDGYNATREGAMSLHEIDDEESGPLRELPTYDPRYYVVVEKAFYNMLLEKFNQPAAPPPSPQPQQPIQVVMPQPEKEPEKRTFKLVMLSQMHLGDINYNFHPGEELEYLPGEYIKIGGQKQTKLKSFIAQWRRQFGNPPDPNLRRPIFQILNPHDCPPLNDSVGRTSLRRYANEEQRIAHEEGRGDASHRRIHVPGETRESNLGMTMAPQPRPEVPGQPFPPHYPNQNQYGPQQAYNPQMGQQPPYNPQTGYYDPSAPVESGQYPPVQVNAQQPFPPQPQSVPAQYAGYNQAPPPQQQIITDPRLQPSDLPPPGGPIGPDGLTARARMIAQMQGDAIERPFGSIAHQNDPNYREPQTVGEFPVSPAVVAGGRTVAHIGGPPADEAAAMSRNRRRY